MLPLGGGAEASKEHEVVQVAMGFLDRDVTEKMAVNSQNVVCPVPQLSPLRLVFAAW